MNLERELDYDALMDTLLTLTREHSILRLSYIGNTILSRPIPMITIGEPTAQKSVLYVSTHHATENLCSSVLLKFIYEYAIAHKRGERVCGINSRVLYKMRKMYIIPMLNPDGVEYRLHGIEELNPLYDRVMKYSNGGDFSKWNANARGVDLNHNYNAYFYEYKSLEKEREITQGPTKYSGESPESEPEVSALTSFIRYNADELVGVISLHSQGEEIYYKSRTLCPEKSDYVARMVSKMTSYKLSTPDDTASYGGLTDWLIKELNIPAFTIECGKGENPLPVSQIARIYLDLRETLFTFPILF